MEGRIYLETMQQIKLRRMAIHMNVISPCVTPNSLDLDSKSAWLLTTSL